MALSLTTSTTLLSQSNLSSPYNISSTFDSGSDASGKILIVLVHTVSSAAPTGVTYNGTSLTKLQDTGEYATSAFTQLFYLVDPADGSNTLVVTGDAGVLGMDIDVQVWTGADETTPFGASDALLVSSTTGDTESISVTNGDVIISMAGIRLFWASNIEPNSGQTERIDNNTYSGNYANSSYEAISSTGSENHGYNWSGGLADDAGWVYGVLQPTQGTQVNDERDAKIKGYDSVYTREAKATLPTNNDDLSTLYDAGDVSDVASDDGTRVELSGAGPYLIHQFKVPNTNQDTAQKITISINLQANTAPSSKSVYLQVYNFNTPGWETIDTESSAAANTDFDLTGEVNSSNENYYDVVNMVSIRVYQDIS